jgi:hypothetical protein
MLGGIQCSQKPKGTSVTHFLINDGWGKLYEHSAGLVTKNYSNKRKMLKTKQKRESDNPLAHSGMKKKKWFQTTKG